MSNEWIFKTLMNLGFKQADAEVYLSLTKSGSQKAPDLARTLKTYKQQIYRSLRNLQAKGFVEPNSEHPAQFTAVSFEIVLDTLMKMNMQEAKRMETEKEDILTRWRKMTGQPSAS